jgi:hypothetical protein
MVYTFARVNAAIGMKEKTTSPKEGSVRLCMRRAATSTRCPVTTR